MGSAVGRAGRLPDASEGSGMALDECAVSESVRVETRRKQVRARRREVGLVRSNMANKGRVQSMGGAGLLVEVGPDVSRAGKMTEWRRKRRKKIHCSG